MRANGQLFSTNFVVQQTVATKNTPNEMEKPQLEVSLKFTQFTKKFVVDRERLRSLSYQQVLLLDKHDRTVMPLKTFGFLEVVALHREWNLIDSQLPKQLQQMKFI